MVQFPERTPSDVLSDAEIARLLNERKQLPATFPECVRLTPRQMHLRYDVAAPGDDGGEFRLMLRQSQEDRLDFSAILAYRPPTSNIWIRLRRYNGKSHGHRNTIEKGPLFFDFHIHTATERYMRRSGKDPEHYAEPTNRYTSLQGAMECLLEDCNFDYPARSQGALWGTSGS
jgi:hypothetical protein